MEIEYMIVVCVLACAEALLLSICAVLIRQDLEEIKNLIENKLSIEENVKHYDEALESTY